MNSSTNFSKNLGTKSERYFYTSQKNIFLKYTFQKNISLNVHFPKCIFGRMDISSKTYFPELTLARMYNWPNGRASERKISRGYEGRYWAPKSYWASQALSEPMPLNHLLSDGCRSFKNEGITIFACN